MSPRLPGARASAGFVLFVHLALSPVVFSRATAEHFELNKLALLLLAVLALAALLAGEVSFRAARPEALTVGVVLFVGSALASTVGSVSRWTSLVGAADSLAGVPTVLALAGLFFATRALCRTPEAARRVLLAPVLGAAAAAGYAVLQWLGWDPMPWARAASFAGAVRPFSTLAHPNFLGAYLAMALPLVGVLGLRASGAARVPFALTGVLCAFAVTASLSRAAWAAVAAALGVLVVGARVLGLWGRLRGWAVALVLVPAGLAAFFLLAAPGSGELPALLSERARHFADPGARHFLWRAAWRIFLEHPLLGCGLDAFALAFQQHREPAYWMLEWDTTPYRAHSDVLQVLATQGLVGLGALLVMTVGLVTAGPRAWRTVPREERPLLLALFAGLAAFVVQGLFGFTVIATGALFFSFAGVLSGLGGGARRVEGNPHPGPLPEGEGVGALWASGGLVLLVFAYNFLGGPSLQEPVGSQASTALLVLAGVTGAVLFGLRRAMPAASSPAPPSTGRAWVRWAVGAGAVALAYFLVFRPYRASQAALEGDLLMPTAPEQAAAAFERATALNPTQSLYWARRGAALQLTATLTPDAAERTRRLSRALEAFQRAVSLVPADAQHRARLGAMLTEFAALNMAAPTQAYAAFDEALARDPHEANFHVQAANAALRLGDPRTARRYALRAVELYPRFGPPRAQLGYLTLQEGQAAQAATLLREALEGEWHGDLASWVAASGNLAAALLESGRGEEARQAAEAAVAQAPESPQAHLVLAQVLEQTGAREEALTQYRRLLGLQPGHPAALEALRRLGHAPTPP
ncbi:MAG TPA: O-antigen ligase family protein [Myxococcaceae bacterium]